MTSFETQIKRIVKEFDFEKVRKVMCALDWTWRDAPNPPSHSDLKEAAVRLLRAVATENQYGHTHATGGFEAKLDFNGDLHLKFVVEEWDGSDYTNGVEDESESKET